MSFSRKGPILQYHDWVSPKGSGQVMMRTCESTIMTILRAVYQKTVFFTYIIGTFYSVFIRIKLDYNQIIGENHVAIVILSIFFFIVFVVFKSFFFKKVRKDICIYVEILVVFYLSILIGLGRNSLLMIAGGAAFTIPKLNQKYCFHQSAYYRMKLLSNLFSFVLCVSGPAHGDNDWEGK